MQLNGRHCADKLVPIWNNKRQEMSNEESPKQAVNIQIKLQVQLECPAWLTHHTVIHICDNNNAEFIVKWE